MRKNYGPWAPDSFSFDSDLAGEALNVLPGTTAYGPFPALDGWSAAYAAAQRGAYASRVAAGTTAIFSGSATKLYKSGVAGGSPTDVTRSSGGDYTGPATNNYWQFDQIDNTVIAVNGVDDNQSINASSGTNFAALGGSPPKARFVKVVGDFVMLGNLATAQGSIASSGSIQVAWSARRIPAEWTFGSKSSDYATLWKGGEVMGLTSQLGGLVFQRRGISRMVLLQGSTRAFDFALIQEEQGTDAPYSIIPHESQVYFYGTDGFGSIGAQGIENIGFGAVDDWFKANCDSDRIGAIYGTLDPVRMMALWLFPTTGNDSTTLDHIIAYDILLKQWVHAEVSATCIFQGAAPGTSLENLGSAGLGYTLETVPASLDSERWQGGALRLAAFNSAHKLSFFSGSPLAAQLRTAIWQPVPGRRTQVNGCRAVDDANAGTGRVGVAQTPQEAISWGGLNALATSGRGAGRIPARVNGKYVQVERNIPAGTSWTGAQGVEFEDAHTDLVDAGGM